jgi:hypothetical protein
MHSYLLDSIMKPARKHVPCVLGLALLMMPGIIAQTVEATSRPQDSVVDAARKAREQQKTGQKPAKVYTNDDLSHLKGDVSVVGQDTAAAPAAAAPGEKSPAATAPESGPQDELYWRRKFADARKKFADDSKELDIMQREYNLKLQQFYADPNAALREQYDRKDLDDTKVKINEKKADVEKDKQAVSDLEDALRKSGGDPGWSIEPPANNNTTPLVPQG